MSLTPNELMAAARPDQRKLFNQISRCLAEFGLTFDAFTDPAVTIADHLSPEAFNWLGEAVKEIDWEDLKRRVRALRTGAPI